jgi:hypothetical protein
VLRRSVRPALPELRSEPVFLVAARCALMAGVRLFRPRAAAAVEPQLALTWARCPTGAAAASGQAPSSPAVDRRAEASEHRSQAQCLPEAWVCRQSLAAA